MKVYSGNFDIVAYKLIQAFLNEADKVTTGSWQSQDVSSNPAMDTRELREVSLCFQMPALANQMAIMTGANLPWAEDHFLERVGGVPLNPPPSNEWWPFKVAGHKEHRIGSQKFAHTYPERFWPKHAGHNPEMCSPKGGWSPILGPLGAYCGRHNGGIRYKYGDLEDLVNLMTKDPHTRQAYLPIWFPEDTGAVEGQRVPCTLGYHFMMRNNRLHITYHMRSCDFMRHFRDDVYMAMRLAHWVRLELRLRLGELIEPGELTMHISSFHVFEGDIPRLESSLIDARERASLGVLGALA